MALTTPSLTPADETSDYGSDFDDSAFELLSQIESQHVKKELVVASIEDIPLPAEHEPQDQRIHLRVSRLPQGDHSWSDDLLGSQERGLREASVEIEYDRGNRGSFSRAYIRDPSSISGLTWLTPPAPHSQPNG
jgi:hypothetical protein